eukprot:COSAG01_NODE_23936_length_796_cov_1.591105_1_plen_126_part_10
MRNWLVVTALRDEEWALWLDADLWSYPPDLVQQMVATDKDFVVPHCVTECALRPPPLAPFVCVLSLLFPGAPPADVLPGLTGVSCLLGRVLVRVRVEIMGSITIRTDRDSPTFLHFGAPIISTRTR